MVIMSTSCISSVVNVTKSKFCTSTHHYDTYQVVSYEQDWTMSCKQVVSYEQDWTMSCKKVIELTCTALPTCIMSHFHLNKAILFDPFFKMPSEEKGFVRMIELILSLGKNAQINARQMSIKFCRDEERSGLSKFKSQFVHMLFI